VSAQPTIGRPAPPPPPSTLSEEQPGQDRTELRPSGGKAGCAPAARALDGVVAPWSPILVASPRAVPRSRLHVLLCTWLTSDPPTAALTSTSTAKSVTLPIKQVSRRGAPA